MLECSVKATASLPQNCFFQIFFLFLRSRVISREICTFIFPLYFSAHVRGA
jgi:hypothetical protein